MPETALQKRGEHSELDTTGEIPEERKPEEKEELTKLANAVGTVDKLAGKGGKKVSRVKRGVFEGGVKNRGGAMSSKLLEEKASDQQQEKKSPLKISQKSKVIVKPVSNSVRIESGVFKRNTLGKPKLCSQGKVRPRSTLKKQRKIISRSG